MKKILVAYATMAGSTAEVARTIGDEIAKEGWQVDVLPLAEVNGFDTYNGIVVGGPMIMGWHRAALSFLRRNRRQIKPIPLAVFVMAMSLTKTADMSVEGVPVFVDEKLPSLPQREGHLSFKERYARVKNYLRPVLAATRPVKPVSIGIFGGRLEYGRLKWWAVLFAMLIIQAPAGDRRNWDAIRQWAAGLRQSFE